MRERVAIIDMSSFSKFEVRGPGALALLQKLASNDIDRPVGAIVYTQLCNERGGIEADVTITRLADDRFYFVTGSALGVRDRSTIERHIPAAGSVTIDEHTSAKAVLNLCGPRSRDVLARLTDAPLGNASFPYMSARELDLGALRPCWRCASRISASWATSCTCRSNTRSTSTRGCGRPAMPLRHRQRGLSRRQQPAPREALSGLGLRHHARLQPVRGGPRLLRGAGKGDFLARDALAGVKARGRGARSRGSPRRPRSTCFGGEIVLEGGRVLGRVTSGGYAYTIGRSLLCAYLAADQPAHADVRGRGDGRALGAVRHSARFYDPDRHAILA